jgi:hypothetical protein
VAAASLVGHTADTSVVAPKAVGPWAEGAERTPAEYAADAASSAVVAAGNHTDSVRTAPELEVAKLAGLCRSWGRRDLVVEREAAAEVVEAVGAVGNAVGSMKGVDWCTMDRTIVVLG